MLPVPGLHVRVNTALFLQTFYQYLSPAFSRPELLSHHLRHNTIIGKDNAVSKIQHRFNAIIEVRTLGVQITGVQPLATGGWLGMLLAGPADGNKEAEDHADAGGASKGRHILAGHGLIGTIGPQILVLDALGVGIRYVGQEPHLAPAVGAFLVLAMPLLLTAGTLHQRARSMTFLCQGIGWNGDGKAFHFGYSCAAEI